MAPIYGPSANLKLFEFGLKISAFKVTRGVNVFPSDFTGLAPGHGEAVTTKETKLPGVQIAFCCTMTQLTGPQIQVG